MSLKHAKRATLYFACLSFTLCMLALALVGTATGATLNVSYNDSIQAAIDAAVSGDEIEVAPGTYTEAINFSGKAIRLYSSKGADVTTIDGTGFLHVVQCITGEGADTVLEGFTITGAYASQNVGGGMYNNPGSPTVTNCVFSVNYASIGGGGMYNGSGSNPTVIDCTFSGNSTWIHGGGMYNYQSSPTVTNCIFTGNIATNLYGGGMYNNYSSPTVTNCTFADNVADAGGGMSNYPQSSPTVTNCTFSYNSARAAGGMHNHVNSSPTVTNCIFTGNIAYDDNGGMINHSGSNAILTNCIFTGNSAGITVGGIQNAGSVVTLTNCTFSGNTAGVDYGGMWDRGGSNSTVTNCIFWGNTPDEITVSESTPTITYSDVQGGWAGTGNIDANPIFADADGRLSPGSQCIDAGDNAAVPADITTDLDGNPRIANDTVDMGAYEYPIIIVQIDIKPGSDPNSINLCSDGAVPIAILGSDTFSVSDIYTETLRFAEAAVKVVGRKDPHALCSVEDVNGDTFDDLVCHYLTADIAAIDGESTTATLNGELLDGTPIEGTDSVNIVKDTCQ